MIVKKQNGERTKEIKQILPPTKDTWLVYYNESDDTLWTQRVVYWVVVEELEHCDNTWYIAWYPVVENYDFGLETLDLNGERNGSYLGMSNVEFPKNQDWTEEIQWKKERNEKRRQKEGTTL